MDAATYFHVSVIGQIEKAIFPLGPDGSEIFCRYEIVTGPDWELITGLKHGITQCAVSNWNTESIAFNMPIEFSYKATNPYGWPQIIFCIYGKNNWGIETTFGYGRAHVPVFGCANQKFAVPILIPRCTTILAEIISWITGKNPELRNAKILAEGTKSKGLECESYGEIVLSLQTMSRGTCSMGYDWGRNDE